MATKKTPKPSPTASAPPVLASELDCFAFLAGLKGARLQGCITDLPYPTLERHRARGTTTRLASSDKSSNPWFGTLTIPQLADALAGVYDALDTNAYAFVYVDDATALLLAAELGVPAKLNALTYRPTSEAPRDRIGFGWWNPCTWVKTSIDKAGVQKLRGGIGYHGVATTERILILEKGKSQLRERFLNAFCAPRPKRKPKGATVQGATAKPIEIAELLARAMSAPGGRILDPFIGCGTHAEGILRAGCQSIVNDIDLTTFRDWMRNVFKRAWMEPRNGQWERQS
jgi:site-specific DNA-methyltransferase (adenine-specific)